MRVRNAASAESAAVDGDGGSLTGLEAGLADGALNRRVELWKTPGEGRVAIETALRSPCAAVVTVEQRLALRIGVARLDVGRAQPIGGVPRTIRARLRDA